MAETTRILEGVFAISKPPKVSSAQVIRDLQLKFSASKLFAPLAQETRRRYEIEDRHQAKRRRRDPDSVFKMGHGGTLDPMATGVLIIAIGRGTKTLQNFLGCTKQYDTVVLFGKSTDTYDTQGKIVGDAPYTQITKAMVEEKLAQFRGHIRQVPPIYSALKINGMKAYEYARSGKELPRELETREMQVDECRMVEHYESGQHSFRWPADEAQEDEKAAAKRLMKGAETTGDLLKTQENLTSSNGQNQETESLVQPTETQPKVLDTNAPTDLPSDDKIVDEAPAEDQLTEVAGKQLQGTSDLATSSDKNASSSTLDPFSKSNELSPETKASLHTHESTNLSIEPAPSPATRVTLTVSSGFYVRSFAHDLGIALGSHGIMAELTRSRQSDYIIPELQAQHPDLTPSLTYADLEAGEDTWGPIISAQLEKWMTNNPLPGQADADGNIIPDDRDRHRTKHFHRVKRGGYGGGGGRGHRYGGRGRSEDNRKRQRD